MFKIFFYSTVAYRNWVRICQIEYENFCTCWCSCLIESFLVLKLQLFATGNSLLNLAMKLLRASYVFFAQQFLTTKLLSHAFPKSPILCNDKLVKGRGGVEDTSLKAKDTTKSEAKAKDSLFEDRASRGQGHRRKCTPKKKVFEIFF